MSELVIPSPLVHDIVWALYDWSKGSKIRMGILVDAFSKEGLGGNSGIEEPTVDYEDTDGIDLLGIGATDHVCDMLKEMEMPLLTSGVIRGINGVLLSEARRRAIDVMSVMVEADLDSLMRELRLHWSRNSMLFYQQHILMINLYLKRRNCLRNN